AFDDAVTAAEALVPNEGRATAGPRPFETYFPTGGSGHVLAGERAFRRDMYYLAGRMLVRSNAGPGRLYEARFAAIHAAVLRRHGPLAAALLDAVEEIDRLALTAQLAAALLVESVRHRPLRPATDGPSGGGSIGSEDV